MPKHIPGFDHVVHIPCNTPTDHRDRFNWVASNLKLVWSVDYVAVSGTTLFYEYWHFYKEEHALLFALKFS